MKLTYEKISRLLCCASNFPCDPPKENTPDDTKKNKTRQNTESELLIEPNDEGTIVLVPGHYSNSHEEPVVTPRDDDIYVARDTFARHTPASQASLTNTDDISDDVFPSE